MTNKQALVKIPQEVLIDSQQILDEAIRMLGPYLVTLSPSERLLFRRAGSGLIKFLKLSHGLAVECPELFPAFMNTEVFREEYFITRELWTLINKIDQLKKCVSDTEILSGCQTFETAMSFYQMVKIAARCNIPCSRVIFDELKSALSSAGRGFKKQKHEDDEGQLELFSD